MFRWLCNNWTAASVARRRLKAKGAPSLARYCHCLPPPKRFCLPIDYYLNRLLSLGSVNPCKAHRVSLPSRTKSKKLRVTSWRVANWQLATEAAVQLQDEDAKGKKEHLHWPATAIAYLRQRHAHDLPRVTAAAAAGGGRGDVSIPFQPDPSSRAASLAPPF